MIESVPPHLDVEGALQRVGNDRALLRELYQAFMADAPNKVRMLSEGLREMDMVKLVKQAHSLKGASAAIGATECRRLSEALEMAGRGEKLDAAQILLPRILEEIGLVMGMLSGDEF